MFKFKQSLAVLAGMALLIGLISRFKEIGTS